MESQDPDSTYVYDAFISYSRTDEAFGRRLEAALERYRPPRGIGHRLRVFRDVQDLVGNDLSQAIHDAVARSRCLIVICSPHARRSAYVAREIDAFGAAHGAERIIAALISGRPNKEVAAADPRQDQAFPEPCQDAEVVGRTTAGA